ncbi:hypothetical protein L615_001200000020 [Nocardioides sp. J9]|nr:hypothetical protein L615_001200000020 [Nocardioides sp. J9]
MLPKWAMAGTKYTIPVTLGKSMPPGATKTPVDLSVTGYRLAWAAISSGRPPALDASALTLAGRDYRNWRIWASLGLIEPYDVHLLRRTKHFAALDPTEKGHLNYALAGAIAKAYAAEKLGCRWLAHLSLAQTSTSYQAAFDPANPKRPDYIGLTDDGSSFFVAEAKGRVVLRSDLKKALDGKEQGKAVASVGGQPVAARYGFAVTATTARTGLYVTDPVEPLQLDVTARQWIHRYYRMMVDIADAIDRVEPAPLRQGDGGGPDADWRPVRLVVPEILREWATGDRDPLTEWDAAETLVALSLGPSAALNPDLTAFVAAVTD